MSMRDRDKASGAGTRLLLEEYKLPSVLQRNALAESNSGPKALPDTLLMQLEALNP